ncbi:hypothetical protein I862_04230 [endosymbiont of Acanthamoeba sp. UWC8]|uniref:3TM-type holin n=1 Tax=endosymbiont of Acanthamoeba sp. UWC8 TaxID=86106 RepID=UPI0004D0D06A|nr:3TM-type holin [endosymbiont of Acanthamoeba sp. UWC8]AIF81406.1 hypothetical protein I862_04230 [endosymbiont of Acanthamoeba sp. UWC8]
MMTLLGTLLGFLGSIFPEIIKLYKDATDKKHEVTLLKMQMDFQTQGHRERLEEINIQADVAESQAIYRTYTTKITWVDALNGTVRPIIAYSFFTLYVLIKFMSFLALPEVGVPFIVVYQTLWTEDDAVIFAGIISFYFGQRALAKARVGR